MRSNTRIPAREEASTTHTNPNIYKQGTPAHMYGRQGVRQQQHHRS